MNNATLFIDGVIETEKNGITDNLSNADFLQTIFGPDQVNLPPLVVSTNYQFGFIPVELLTDGSQTDRVTNAVVAADPGAGDPLGRLVRLPAKVLHEILRDHIEMIPSEGALESPKVAEVSERAGLRLLAGGQ